MSGLTIIFITIIISCLEIAFFGVMLCKEIEDWLNDKADELRAKEGRR